MALIFILKERLYLTGLHVLLLLALSFFWLKDHERSSHLDAAKSDNNVRFYCQNVHQFCNDSLVLNNIADQIKRCNPQIVCLQEFGLMNRWPNIKSVADEFSNKTDLPYYDFTPTPGNVFGTAVFSKYPIQNVDTIFQLLSYTNEAKFYQINIDGVELRFINTHLQSFNLGSFFTSEKMTMSHILKLKVEQLSSVLNDQFKSDLILGDFNTLPGSALYRQMISHNFRDAQVEKGNPADPTLPMIFNRIDYVFVDSHIPILEFQLLDQAGSDHRALLVNVAL